jgi:hypothetical protein
MDWAALGGQVEMNMKAARDLARKMGCTLDFRKGRW